MIHGSGAKEKDLLLECESTAIATEWLVAIRLNIESVSRPPAGPSTPQDSEPPPAGPLSLDLSSRPAEVPVEGRAAERVHLGPFLPVPGWVIKVLRVNGEKLFVNLCSHDEVLATPVSIGFNKWPHMLLFPMRTISDGGVEVCVYDVIISSQSGEVCARDPKAKDAACLRALRLLKKQFSEEIEFEYKLPKITKRYKGELREFVIPAAPEDLTGSTGTGGGASRALAALVKPIRRASMLGMDLKRQNTEPVHTETAQERVLPRSTNSYPSNLNPNLADDSAPGPVPIKPNPNPVNLDLNAANPNLGNISSTYPNLGTTNSSTNPNLTTNSSTYPNLRTSSSANPNLGSNLGSSSSANPNLGPSLGTSSSTNSTASPTLSTKSASNPNLTNSSNNNSSPNLASISSNSSSSQPAATNPNPIASNPNLSNPRPPPRPSTPPPNPNPPLPRLLSQSGIFPLIDEAPDTASPATSTGPRTPPPPQSPAPSTRPHLPDPNPNPPDKVRIPTFKQAVKRASLLSTAVHNMAPATGSSVRPTRAVCFSVVKQNGVTTRSSPDGDPRAAGRVLRQGLRILVAARRDLPLQPSSSGTGRPSSDDGPRARVGWLRLHCKTADTEEWVCERNMLASEWWLERSVVPAALGVCAGVSVVNTSLSEGASPVSGGLWDFMFGTAAVGSGGVQVSFTIELVLSDDSFVRILRSYEELCSLRTALLSSANGDQRLQDKARQAESAGVFPCLEEGGDLVEDAQEMLRLVEGAEQWLRRVLVGIQLDCCKCRAALDFSAPRDSDFPLVDPELRAAS
mmetsp:Transcript_21067/g.30190  ORF Transcript_21067/g.30190 Transcript_21067/m.30190 type:complete len:798 (-) Transcript_21067:18-2411(-)